MTARATPDAAADAGADAVSPGGPRVALVLSGGGAKTAAHLGAWRALAEAGLRPAHVVAVSMGAVVAAALGAGATPDEVLARFTEVGRGSVVPDPAAPGAGVAARALLLGEPLRQAIEAVVPARSFEELAVPLTVPVVDLDRGERLLYGAGGRAAPLVDVLWATCALPVYFPPVMLDGRRCADGGLAGALPLGVAGELDVDLVVAVDVGAGVESPDLVASGGRAPATGAAVPALLRAHDEATSALMAAITATELACWRAAARAARPRLVYVRPPVERHATFRIDQLARYAAAGYQAAREALDSAI